MHPNPSAATRTPSHAWSAVGSMAMCVALLIASEFMPVSLADAHRANGLVKLGRDLR
jgi:predicted MFS family arabinose efflux permease